MAEFLEVITRRPNTVITPHSYCKLAWDEPYYDPSNLRPHLTKLRKQISADPATFIIRAIPDLGYILQDHNWATEATSIPLIANGTIRYYPDTRDFAANGDIVPTNQNRGQNCSNPCRINRQSRSPSSPELTWSQRQAFQRLHCSPYT